MDYQTVTIGENNAVEVVTPHGVVTVRVHAEGETSVSIARAPITLLRLLQFSELRARLSIKPNVRSSADTHADNRTADTAGADDDDTPSEAARNFARGIKERQQRGGKS